MEGLHGQKMKKKNVRIGAAAAGAAAVICAGIGLYLYLAERNAGEGYEELREEVESDQVQEETDDPDPPVQIPIDFEALRQKNPDVYAWITVPGTPIDYPILQRADDNSYYLSHTIDHEEKVEGAIFTENYNSTDFEDPNTVIYGHDMRNGTMFRSLLDYQDREFFEANKQIVIYTPDAVRHYEIFASYPYDNRHILLSFDFSDKSVYRQYLENIFSIRDMNACIDDSVNVDTDDKIITLSTCYGVQRNKRYLVQAVLTEVEQGTTN